MWVWLNCTIFTAQSTFIRHGSPYGRPIAIHHSKWLQILRRNQHGNSFTRWFAVSLQFPASNLISKWNCMIWSLRRQFIEFVVRIDERMGIGELSRTAKDRHTFAKWTTFTAASHIDDVHWDCQCRHRQFDGAIVHKSSGQQTGSSRFCVSTNCECRILKWKRENEKKYRFQPLWTNK